MSPFALAHALHEVYGCPLSSKAHGHYEYDGGCPRFIQLQQDASRLIAIARDVENGDRPPPPVPGQLAILESQP